jgi:DNA-binding GntR family transcriptional regulator
MQRPQLQSGLDPIFPPARPDAGTITDISGDTANERAYASIKRAVLAGRFKPGENLTLRSLAKNFAVGDMAVREAVKRLVSEGAFEALPNRSARVPLPKMREIQQILDLRVLLESRAAYLAAQNITLHQIEHLRTMHLAMKAATALGDIHRYEQVSLEFHFEIYRIADNKVLATLIEALWLRMAPVTARTIALMTAKPNDFDRLGSCHHETLLAAFQNRDAEGARTAMQRDLLALSEIDGYWEAIEGAL